jgi:hypothetical protein
MSEQPIRTGVGDEVFRCLEERVMQRRFLADELSELVHLVRFIRYERVSEAVGGACEFDADPGIYRRIVPLVIRKLGTQKMRQEFIICDVRDLRGDDCTRLLVQVLRRERRILGHQSVDLIVMFPDEKRLQRGQRWILRSAHVAGKELSVDDRRVVAVRRGEVAVGEPQACGDLFA